MLTQNFQMLTGTLTAGGKSTPIAGRLNGEEITFTVGEAQYTGRVAGNTMSGQVNGKPLERRQEIAAARNQRPDGFQGT